MKTKWVVMIFGWSVIAVIEGLQPLYAQLDTLNFPFTIGNKWFYRYSSTATPLPYVLVKTIVDTTQDGARIIQVKKFHGDSILATERWILQNGALYLNSIQSLPIYNSSLTHDTTWSLYGSTYSYKLMRVVLFDLNIRCQVFISDYFNLFTEFYKEFGVAPGVGIYNYYYKTWGQDISWTESSTLIGLIKNGQFYGDTVLTSVEDPYRFVPEVFCLRQNYPNPFNPATKIKFQISHDGPVILEVYDLRGHKVATLLDAQCLAGEHQVEFNATGFASGIYLYRLKSGRTSLSKKMLLIQ